MAHYRQKGFAQEYPFDGLNMSLGNLSRLSDAKTHVDIEPSDFVILARL